MNYILLALLMISCITPVSVVASTAESQAALDAKLSSEVQTYSIAEDNLLEALAKISSDFQLPMGIEWESSTVPYHPVKLALQKITLLQLVEDVVSVEPLYHVSTSNGVVHVAKAALSNDSRNFLNIRVDDFELSSEYVYHANNRLRRIVAERANSSSTEQVGGGCAGSFGVGAGDQIVSFRVTDVSVRDLLDRFVTSAGFNIWLVTFPELKSTTAKGFFRSISIFAPDLPVAQLPAWDLLLPGYDPVRKEVRPEWRRGR